jgi:hypothetical protein
MLHTTRATFYLRELWRSESVFGVFALAAAICALATGIVRRKREDLLIAAWALGPLALFSLAASRYDHYLLLAYPALALAAAQLLIVKFTITLRPAFAAAFVLALAAWHLPRDLAVFDGDDELRAVLRSAPKAHLYAFNLHTYAARWYLDSDVTTLLESADDVIAAVELRKAGLPSSVAYARNLPATVRSLERPFTLLMPRARMDLMVGVELKTIGETQHYLLLAGLP